MAEMARLRSENRFSASLHLLRVVEGGSLTQRPHACILPHLDILHLQIGRVGIPLGLGTHSQLEEPLGCEQEKDPSRTRPKKIELSQQAQWISSVQELPIPGASFRVQRNGGTRATTL
jgi:hypothetical protein